jgi:hypothetical protein
MRAMGTPVSAGDWTAPDEHAINPQASSEMM